MISLKKSIILILLVFPLFLNAQKEKEVLKIKNISFKIGKGKDKYWQDYGLYQLYNNRSSIPFSASLYERYEGLLISEANSIQGIFDIKITLQPFNKSSNKSIGNSSVSFGFSYFVNKTSYANYRLKDRYIDADLNDPTYISIREKIDAFVIETEYKFFTESFWKKFSLYGGGGVGVGATTNIQTLFSNKEEAYTEDAPQFLLKLYMPIGIRYNLNSIVNVVAEYKSSTYAQNIFKRYSTSYIRNQHLLLIGIELSNPFIEIKK